MQQRITRSKSFSEGDKYEKPSTGYRRRRTASQKYYENGLSGIFIGSLPRGATAKEVKEAVVKKEVNAAHVELIGRKRIAFAYFDKPEYEVLLEKLKDLKVKERTCKVEVMKSPPRNSRLKEAVPVKQTKFRQLGFLRDLKRFLRPKTTIRGRGVFLVLV